MIDRETATEAAGLISVAIAELTEDVHNTAVRSAASLGAYAQRAQTLRQAGADIAALAEALAVLGRWGEAAE